MRPVIGIVASIGLHGERFFVGRDYITAIVLAGGVPVILPVLEGWDAIGRQLGILDGGLLVGGYDADPAIYGEEPVPKLGPVFPERDKYEIMVLETLVRRKKPVLGICRGIQMINIAFGGTLYQDLSLAAETVVQHYQNCQKHVAGHSVEVFPGTLLHEIVGSSLFRANSYHHQAVKKVAPGFCINARSKDGVIEGIESKDKSVLGVQWHPEAMVNNSPVMLRIFEWLITTAAQRIK